MIGWRRALQQVETLVHAFEAHSTEFRVTLVDICPIVEDCKLIHHPSGTIVFIEIKARHYKIAVDAETGASVLRHNSKSLGVGRPVFSWQMQWDYIYTTMTTVDDRDRDEDDNAEDHERDSHGDDDDERLSVTEAFLLPRDAIPAEWWTLPTKPGLSLRWRADSSVDYRQFAVDPSTPRRLVETIEAIFDKRQLECGSIKAQRTQPQRLETDIEGEAVASKSRDTTTGEHSLIPKKPWFSDAFQQGFGSSLHPTMRGRTYEVWASETLLELCRAWSVQCKIPCVYLCILTSR